MSSSSYVGDALTPIASTSSIGTLTSYDLLSISYYLEPLPVAARIFPAGGLNESVFF